MNQVTEFVAKKEGKQDGKHSFSIEIEFVGWKLINPELELGYNFRI